MVKKVFRIICNSDDYLTAEVVAQALLRHITLNPAKPNVVFGVIEEMKNIDKHEQAKKIYSS